MDEKEREERTHKALLRLTSNINSCGEAQRLVEKGDFPEALAAFMKGLNGSVGGFMHSSHTSSIEKLISEYPPAREAFEKKRDELESQMKKKGQFKPLYDMWMEINNALGDQYREIEFLKYIYENPEELDETAKYTAFHTIKLGLPKYLNDRRYEVAEPYLNKMGTMFLLTVHRYACDLYFPEFDDSPEQTEFRINFSRQEILEEAPLLYELCLALQKEPQANEIAREVFAVSNSVETFRSFLAAAIRVGSKNRAKDLLEKAKQMLSSEELDGLKKDLNL